VCRSNSKGSLKGAEPAHTSQDLRPVLQLPAGGVPDNRPSPPIPEKLCVSSRTLIDTQTCAGCPRGAVHQSPLAL
jgi:hypothetical protein